MNFRQISQFRVSLVFCMSLLVQISATGMSSAHAASFDCAKARTPTEKTICADTTISGLDADVGQAFKTSQALWPAGNWKDFLRAEQREWLKTRDAECKSDVACLKMDYERRLAFLRHPHLKYMGRYVAGTCPGNGTYLDVTPSYPADGVEVLLYICPNSAGNVLLQTAGKVNPNGELRFEDAGCSRSLRFEQDMVTLSAMDKGRCALSVKDDRFRRDARKSPYENE
ncbi:lysozyme inhibitor LprI family protein [Undibacterium sp. Ji49W]|uniref:lysozyme inhibitor LprI family protein n=1 Tax=Undibacterium sp. Ji49W TaxID=3413040 RepID=UPI003BEF8D93